MTIERQATSIKVRPDVWKAAKIEAVKRDKDLSVLVEEALISYLKLKLD